MVDVDFDLLLIAYNDGTCSKRCSYLSRRTQKILGMSIQGKVGTCRHPLGESVSVRPDDSICRPHYAALVELLRESDDETAALLKILQSVPEFDLSDDRSVVRSTSGTDTAGNPNYVWHVYLRGEHEVTYTYLSDIVDLAIPEVDEGDEDG